MNADAPVILDLRDVSKTLPLHEPDKEPYALGVFLMGAYQDVLGSAHNLFGKVNEVHVHINDDGSFELENFVRGQKARRLIEAMGYSAPQLSASVRDDVQDAIKRGAIGPAEGDSFIEHFDEELVGYTYLE